MRYTNRQLATALIETVASGYDVQQVTDEFVKMLAKEQELSRIRDLVRCIEQIWKDRYGASTITVETASALTNAMKKKIEQIAYGAEVKEIIDQKLLGGARVRIDDSILDGSLLGRLNQLRTHLLDS